MILHIVPDDKFIDMAYEMFEKASPQNNEFLVVTKRDSFQYIKTAPVSKISLKKFISKKFANSLVKYDFVVIHWLDGAKMQLLFNAPKSVKFLWIGWGGDYYHFITDNLFLPKTKQLFKNREKKSLLNKIKHFVFKHVYLKDTKNIETCINRISYFAPVLSTEYEMVAKNFKHFNPKFIEWNYGTIENNIKGIGNLGIRGNNILLGNSATYENNHLEVFDIVEKLNIEGRNVIAPLSYGDEFYKEKIIEEGYKRFKYFKPLTTFMALKEYNNIISTCSIVIMNHLRQQALGNITVMMYFGAKVFLNKNNPAYKYYKNLGAILFSMEELNNDEIEKNLTQEEIEKNRKILIDNFNRDTMLKKTRNLIKTLQEEKV